MTEKTAEEKLRQALEDSFTGGESQEHSQEKARPKPSRRRTRTPSRRADIAETPGQRVDSFIDDFERKIEQSLSAVKSPSERQEKPRAVRKTSAQKPKPSPSKPDLKPEPKPEVPISPQENPKPAPIAHEPETVPEVIPEIVASPEPELPEILPVIEPVPEPVPEIQPETEILPVPEPEPQEAAPVIPEIVPEIEPELPEIPVIEAVDTMNMPEAAEIIPETSGQLPEIPVIEPEPDDDEEELSDFMADENLFVPEESSEITPDTEDSDIPVIADDETEEADEEPLELQEAELVEAQQPDEEFADDIDDFVAEIKPEDSAPQEWTDDDAEIFGDEPIDETPAPAEAEYEDAEPYDLDEDEAGLFSDSEVEEAPADFSPSADVVVNVDDELPHILPPEVPENDPESEASPVTVTMPETTKTAEDKLMADIAEAMTGNPLTLETQEAPGLYNLPEGFLTDNDASGSSQSAEDKLKANIAQALSESPISTAQDQARQNLEDDLNPFDDLPIPDTLFQREESQELEPEPQAIPEPEELSLPEEIEQAQEDDNEDKEEEEEEFLPDFDELPSSEPEDMPEVPEISDEAAELPDIAAEEDAEIEPEEEPEEHEETENIPEPDDMPFPEEEETEGKEEEYPPIPDIEPEPEPMTEAQRLEQEIAALSQQEDIPEPEGTEQYTETINEEAEPESEMPEQSLIDENAFSAEEPDDNWDISSLGELGEATTFQDQEEPEPLPTVPEPEPEPEEVKQSAGIIQSEEKEHKEKTMKIREKLANRKNGSEPGGKSGILLISLLAILAIIGGLMLWQIMQLSDKITSMAMNSPAFESVSGNDLNPSYSYAIDFILDPNLTDRMAQRGREGWQVVGSRRTQDSTTGQYGYEFIFMRRTPGR